MADEEITNRGYTILVGTMGDFPQSTDTTVPHAPRRCCFNGGCRPTPADVAVYQLAGDLLPGYMVEVTDGIDERLVNIQVAVAGYWLFRVWLTDGPDITDQETLVPPDQPGAASFFKATNADGLASFSIISSVPSTHYVQAALVGPVFSIGPVTVGVPL